MVVEKTGDAMVVEKTGAWTGKKKAKVQRPPTSEDLGMTAPVINTEPTGQIEGFDWKQVEGFDWTEADVKEEIDSYYGNVGLPGIDDEFWNLCDDKETEEINRRLALAHIRAYKGAGMKDEQLLPMLEEDGYFRCYETFPKWYFDRQRCEIAGFQDYQRLELYDDGYVDCPFYHKACSTFESDQQFVRLWETLSDKTKWLQHYHKLTPEEREIMCRVMDYHAVKIRAYCPQIYSMLLVPFLTDFLHRTTNYHYYARLYLDIWKRVAKQKMDVKDAVDEVKGEAKWSYNLAAVNAELKRDNYKRYVADIDENLEEGEAYWLIVEAVKKFAPGLRTYYDYAKRKLEIAEKMALINSSPPTSST